LTLVTYYNSTLRQLSTFAYALMADHADKSDVAHLEHRAGSVGDDRIAPVMHEHRENDDRAEDAMGRNADAFEKRYWLSVNYIGTLFAIGIAFMGGIGGM
jgi:hypothetical protein